jgi:broad specificity phosphatase PhoE
LSKREESLTRAILIRHGQTVWNKGDRFRGQIDLDLDDLGLRQAQAIASHVSHWPVSRLFSSPLKRAWQTAKAVGDPMGLETQRLGGFNDINYGQWQGRTPAEVAAEQPALYLQWQTQPNLVTFPEGESLEQIRIRATTALEELLARYPGETMVIVSHKVVCKLLVLYVLGLNTSHFWNVEQDNGAINIFEARNNMLLAALINDTCHLKNIKTEKTIS